MPASWRKGTLYAGMCLDRREWASATLRVARRPELNLLSLRLGVTWIPAFAGKTGGMGRGLRGFRLLPERRVGWEGIPAFAGKTVGMGRVTWIPAFAGKTVGMGGGYVGSGFCRKDGWDGEGVRWIPAFAGKTVGNSFRRKDDIWAKGTVGLLPNSGMTTDRRVVELILRQVLNRGGAVGGWDDTILPTPRRPAAPWSPRSGVPPVARRWAGLPGCCRRERKGLANRSGRTGRCR